MNWCERCGCEQIIGHRAASQVLSSLFVPKHPATTYVRHRHRCLSCQRLVCSRCITGLNGCCRDCITSYTGLQDLLDQIFLSVTIVKPRAA